jgi:hypothetical protein
VPVKLPSHQAVMLSWGLAFARLERGEVLARFDGGVLSIAVVGGDSWTEGASAPVREYQTQDHVIPAASARSAVSLLLLVCPVFC